MVEREPVIAPTTTTMGTADRMRDAGVSVLPVVDDSYEGFVTVDQPAPYLPRHRLDISWDGEPIRLSET